MQKVPVKILREGAALPTYGTASSAGADLRACLDAPVVLAPGETRLIPIGIAMEIPEGYVGLVFARSGPGLQRRTWPRPTRSALSTPDYRGRSPRRACTTTATQSAAVEPGERIAQLILTPVSDGGVPTETETLTGH